MTLNTDAPVSLTFLAKATLVVLALVALFWFLDQIASVLLLLFGAITVAVVLRAAADLVHLGTRLRSPWALGLAILTLVAALALLSYLLGAQLIVELAGLSQNLPGAVDSLGERIGMEDLWQQISQFGQLSWFADLVGYLPQALGALSSAVLVVVGGIFLAARPAQYIEGIVVLVPNSRRQRLRDVFGKAGRALRLWLVGKVISMLVIGVATTAGLFVLGMPSALALGAIAGALEYIPFVGPLISFVPAALVALQQENGTIWWVLGLYLLVQQVESNLLVPLIQKRTVELPPVLGLFAIVALGILFGPLGFIFGIPLTVVTMVLVKELYVRDVLGDPVEVPGDK